jgi:translation initiation factor IF-3
MAELKLPTEIVSLPSKGLLYPKESPLSKGEIEMKYMTAREEDILTNSNFIKNGTVIDKLLQSLIVTPINYDDLLIGDKNAILIAARILGYGAEYAFKYSNERGQELDAKVDLSKLEEKQIDELLFKAGTNEFTFTLPKSGNVVTFKLLTHGDEKKIEAEIKGLKKINPNSSFDVTTRLKYMITSVNSDREQKAIRDFVDNYMLAPDARSLREYYATVQPDIEMKFIPEDESYTGEGIAIPISLNFFWPDAGL